MSSSCSAGYGKAAVYYIWSWFGLVWYAAAERGDVGQRCGGRCSKLIQKCSVTTLCCGRLSALCVSSDSESLTTFRSRTLCAVRYGIAEFLDASSGGKSRGDKSRGDKSRGDKSRGDKYAEAEGVSVSEVESSEIYLPDTTTERDETERNRTSEGEAFLLRADSGKSGSMCPARIQFFFETMWGDAFYRCVVTDSNRWRVPMGQVRRGGMSERRAMERSENNFWWDYGNERSELSERRKAFSDPDKSGRRDVALIQSIGAPLGKAAVCW